MSEQDLMGDLRRAQLETDRKNRNNAGNKLGRFMSRTLLGAIPGAILVGGAAALLAPTDSLALAIGIAGALGGAVISHIAAEREQANANRGRETSAQDAANAKLSQVIKQTEAGQRRDRSQAELDAKAEARRAYLESLKH